MTVNGTLTKVSSVKVGESHQHTDNTYVSVYGQLLVDLVSETDQEIVIKMNAAFHYAGYQNYIPWEMGAYKVTKDATDINGFGEGKSVGGAWEQVASMRPDSGWVWYWVGEQTFTFEKTDEEYGIMPYFKIGAINRWASLGDYGSGDYWVFGNTYGVLCQQSATESATAVGLIHRGLSINCWAILGGKMDSSAGNANANTANWTYSNCPIIAGGTSEPTNKRRVLSIAYYDSAGTARIVPMMG